MKQLTLIAVFLLLTILGRNQLSAQATMYVHQTNLTQSAYPLDSIRKLTFPAGVMQVHRTIGDTIAYTFSNIRYVDFTGLSTGVTAPLVQNINAGVYPNPADDVLNVNFSSLMNEIVTIEILDLQGRVLIAEQSTASLNGNNQLVLSTSGLSQGVYFCRVITGEKMENIKFLKN